MGRGLEIFDANGKKVLTSTTNVSFLLNVITEIRTSGSLVDDRVLQGKPFFFFPDQSFNIVFFGSILRGSIVGNVVSWNYSAFTGQTRLGRMAYGITL